MTSLHLKTRNGRRIAALQSAGLAMAAVLSMLQPAASQDQITCTIESGCSDRLSQPQRTQIRSARRQRTHKALRAERVASRGTVIGGRPAGCPHDYCGCGLRIHLGLSDKRLNLAWNWARAFPRTSAQAGAAAVRHHHVMLLEHHVSGWRWVVRDYNSGNGLSRIHERDVRGYIFVNPKVNTRLAMVRF
jgi:hypothetical protein